MSFKQRPNMITDALLQRIEVIRQALFANLKRILAATLQKPWSSKAEDADQNNRTLRNCLEVYNTIQGWREAEQVVKQIVSEGIRSVSFKVSMRSGPEC